MAGRSELVREALDVAHAAHAGQVRSGSVGIPYIEHPVAVAELLAELDFPDEVLAAALLHDVVEDSEVEIADVRERFDDRVAGLVAALTDDGSIEPYTRRKEAHRREVAAAGPEALAIFAADKLTNVRMLRELYAQEGEDAANQLKVPLDEKIEVWRLDLETVRAGAADLPFASQLAGEIDALSASRPGGTSPA